MQIFMIALAALVRLIPHPWNMTPVGGFGLFAGATMPLRTALLVPLAATLLADSLIGFYAWPSMVGVYAGLAMSVVIGRYVIRGRERVGYIAGAVGLNVVAFFLISNFGVWASGYYGYSFEGLVACYAAGLPFMGYSLAGDALYAGLLFGLKALYERRTGRPVPGLAGSAA